MGFFCLLRNGKQFRSGRLHLKGCLVAAYARFKFIQPGIGIELLIHSLNHPKFMCTLGRADIRRKLGVKDPFGRIDQRSLILGRQKTRIPSCRLRKLHAISVQIHRNESGQFLCFTSKTKNGPRSKTGAIPDRSSGQGYAFTRAMDRISVGHGLDDAQLICMLSNAG